MIQLSNRRRAAVASVLFLALSTPMASHAAASPADAPVADEVLPKGTTTRDAETPAAAGLIGGIAKDAASTDSPASDAAASTKVPAPRAQAEFPDRLRCEISQRHACTTDGCIAVDAEALNTPGTLTFDAKLGMVIGARPDGTEVRTPAVLRTRIGGGVALQGTEGPYAWSAVFDASVAKVTVMIGASEFGAILFGACKAD